MRSFGGARALLCWVTLLGVALWADVRLSWAEQGAEQGAEPGAGSSAAPDPQEDTITVSATRAPSAPTQVTLTRDALSAAPRRDAEELLRQIPNLTLLQHGSEGKGRQVLLRGFDAVHGQDFEVTVEGVRLNEQSNIHAQGYLDLALMIPECVASVEGLKGPFSLSQGPFAVAGSARYALGAPRLSGEGGGGGGGEGPRLAYGFGTTNRHRALLSYTRGGGWVAAEGVHDEGFGARRALSRAALNARLPLAEGSLGRLTLTALGAASTFELPTALRQGDLEGGRVGFDGSYEDRLGGDSLRALTLLRWERAGEGGGLWATLWGQRRELWLTENFTGALIDPVSGDARAQRHSASAAGLEVRGERRLAGGAWGAVGLVGEGGGTAERLAQREERLGRALEPLGARRALSGAQGLSHLALGARLLAGGVSVEGGGRLDAVWARVADGLTPASPPRLEWATALSPRLIARWRLSPSLTLGAAYGRGLRPPEARALSGFRAERVGVSEEVRGPSGGLVTRSDAGEVGARPSWGGRALWGAGFLTLIDQESIFDHVSGVNLTLNGTRRAGVEAGASWAPARWAQVSVEGAATSARFRESGAPVPFAPPLTGGARLSLRGWGALEGLRGGARLLAVAPRPLPHGAISGAVSRLDLTASLSRGAWSLSLEVENALSANLRDGEYHYASDWRGSGGGGGPLPSLHFMAGPPLNARLMVGYAP